MFCFVLLHTLVPIQHVLDVGGCHRYLCIGNGCAIGSDFWQQQKRHRSEFAPNIEDHWVVGQHLELDQARHAGWRRRVLQVDPSSGCNRGQIAKQMQNEFSGFGNAASMIARGR